MCLSNNPKYRLTITYSSPHVCLGLCHVSYVFTGALHSLAQKYRHFKIAGSGFNLGILLGLGGWTRCWPRKGYYMWMSGRFRTLDRLKNYNIAYHLRLAIQSPARWWATGWTAKDGRRLVLEIAKPSASFIRSWAVPFNRYGGEHVRVNSFRRPFLQKGSVSLSDAVPIEGPTNQAQSGLTTCQDNLKVRFVQWI